MADLELKRDPRDARLYVLEGVGTLRLEGLGRRRGTAQAGEESWRIKRGGFWRRAFEATDALGTAVGEFQPRAVRRGGRLRWGGRELTLLPASSLRQRYALADGDLELAVFDGKAWGSRPVKVTVNEPGTTEPGLLLFAAFVVRGLARDAAAAGAGASGSSG